MSNKNPDHFSPLSRHGVYYTLCTQTHSLQSISIRRLVVAMKKKIPIYGKQWQNWGQNCKTPVKKMGLNGAQINAVQCVAVGYIRTTHSFKESQLQHPTHWVKRELDGAANKRGFFFSCLLIYKRKGQEFIILSRGHPLCVRRSNIYPTWI